MKHPLTPDALARKYRLRATGFLSGIASLLDIGCTYTQRSQSMTPEEEDWNAIHSDWAAVGNDLANAARKFDSKQQTVTGQPAPAAGPGS